MASKENSEGDTFEEVWEKKDRERREQAYQDTLELNRQLHVEQHERDVIRLRDDQVFRENLFVREQQFAMDRDNDNKQFNHARDRRIVWFDAMNSVLGGMQNGGGGSSTYHAAGVAAHAAEVADRALEEFDKRWPRTGPLGGVVAGSPQPLERSR